jgi:NAD(P)-dependent dehydrogenase (short-subunit alcohol dehydrogenase family)
MSILDAFRLDGTVAVVTGASSGLGVAFARALAEAGADIVLAARRADRLAAVADEARALGRQALPVVADVAKPADCAAVADAAIAAYGRVDVLVNNAGIATAVPASRETPDEFRQVLDVNLMGAYWMSQACGRMMRSGGSIINVSSVLATTTAGLPQAAYSASKAGLLGLTRDLAAQWSGRKGIRVNAVQPGLFLTEMSDQYPAGYADNVVCTRVPLGRPGRAEECASAVVFLASAASSYVTGAVLAVDGGFTIT